MFKLFKRKELTPEEIAEKEEAVRVKEEKRKYSLRKLNIDANNPDVNYHDISLSINELNHIIKKLQVVGSYKGTYGERPEDQRNPSRYRAYEVQALLDYAKGCRYAMDWMMKNSIKHGVAHYNDKGTFKFKEIESEMKDNIKGGHGTCPKCGEYVSNVSLHTTLCGTSDGVCKACKGRGSIIEGGNTLFTGTKVTCKSCKGTGNES